MVGHFIIVHLFDWLGVSMIAAVFIGLAVVAFYLRMTHLGLLFAMVAAAEIYSGAIYHSGQRAANAKWQAEVAAATDAVQKKNDAALAAADQQAKIDDALVAALSKKVQEYEAQLSQDKVCLATQKDQEHFDGLIP